MHEVGGPSRGDRLGRDDSEVHSAIRFAVVAAVVGVGFLIMGALLVSTCSGVDTAACGPPQRILLALGGPLICVRPGCGRFCAPTGYGVRKVPGGDGTAPAGFC